MRISGFAAVLLTMVMVNSAAAGIFSTYKSGEYELQGSSSKSPDLDIGLAAYVNVGPVDLSYAEKLFTRIDYSDNEKLLGRYSFYTDSYKTEEVGLFINKDGYIAVYYGKNDPASKVVQWSSSTIIYSKFATALTSLSNSLLGYQIDYRNIKYFDYRYPDANRILVVTQASSETTTSNGYNSYGYGNLKFNIPQDAVIYEVSYSMYMNSYPYDGSTSTMNIAIDSDILDSMTGDGVISGFYDGHISQDKDHLFGSLGTLGVQSAGALVIIYNSKKSISVSQADTYWDTALEAQTTKEIPEEKIPTPEKPVPTKPRPVRTTIPVSIPTEEVTPKETDRANVGGSPTPVSTPASLKPSTASVNLYGEKTDVELGENILLRLSAVNLITKPKMAVQVIIIPPSGFSISSAEFAETMAGQYTTTYQLEPGKGRDIEVKIIGNQIGEFDVEGRIVYYFGDNKESGEDHTRTLKIKVRERGQGSGQKGSGQTTSSVGTLSINTPEKTPGFEIFGTILSFLVLFLFMANRKIIKR